MKVAFLYYSEHIAATVSDHILSFLDYGQFEYRFFDLAHEKLASDHLKSFDCIVIHYTACVVFEERFSLQTRLVVRNASAKKILFIQDEYRKINDVVDIIRFLGIDILFTCFPESEFEKVYPKKLLPNLKRFNTLTGYVPQNLKVQSQRSYKERKIDVVYRARPLSAWYGRLGREKWVIGEKFNKDAKKHRLKTDISYLEEDRIYGAKWTEFLLNSKAVLGCESGASVCDFTGEIQQKVERYELFYPNASFEEIEAKFFPGLDGKIYLNQISPRAFECAALRTLMILYEGKYSNILQPWKHYVPLKKDHSNMKEVVEAVKNPVLWEEITERAYKEIANNPLYSYQRFIEDFEKKVATHFAYKSTAQKTQKNIEVVQQERKKVTQSFAKKKRGLFLKVITYCIKVLYKVLPLMKMAWKISRAFSIERLYKKYGVCALFQGYNPKRKALILYLGRPDPDMGLLKLKRPIKIPKEVGVFFFCADTATIVPRQLRNYSVVFSMDRFMVAVFLGIVAFFSKLRSLFSKD